MTDRHAGYIIVLDEDIREDDAQELIKLLRQIRGVIKVTPVIGGAEIVIAKERAKQELGQQIWKILYP